MSHRHDLKLIMPQIELFDFPYKHGLPLTLFQEKTPLDAEARLWEPSSANRQQTLKALPSESLHFPYFSIFTAYYPPLMAHPPKHLYCSPSQLVYTFMLLPFLKSFNNKCAYSGPRASHFPTFLVKKIKSFLAFIC